MSIAEFRVLPHEKTLFMRFRRTQLIGHEAQAKRMLVDAINKDCNDCFVDAVVLGIRAQRAFRESLVLPSRRPSTPPAPFFQPSLPHRQGQGLDRHRPHRRDRSHQAGGGSGPKRFRRAQEGQVRGRGCCAVQPPGRPYQRGRCTDRYACRWPHLRHPSRTLPRLVARTALREEDLLLQARHQSSAPEQRLGSTGIGRSASAKAVRQHRDEPFEHGTTRYSFEQPCRGRQDQCSRVRI